MATVQVIDGSTAVTATSTKNDGGTIVNAGNADTTGGPISKILGLNTLADDVGDAIGSRVLVHSGTGSAQTDRAGVAKAVSAGTIAYNAGPTEWVMAGGNVSATIGGVANTVLVSAGSDYDGAIRDSVHGTITDRKVGVTPVINVLAAPSTTINGYRTKGAGAGNANLYINPADGTDAVASEIFPTRSVPGELTYHFGGLGVPTNADYKAKDANE